MQHCDMTALLTHGTGGGILASAKTAKTNDLGKYVILVGLAIQIIFFGFFFIVTIAFHRRIIREPTTVSRHTDIPWRSYILVLYTVSALILVRSVFRVAEYAMGKDGELMSKEIYIYIFDSLLIFICVVIFNIWHPSRVVSTYTRAKTPSETQMQDLGP
ncbi:hypothetical protein EsH8_V_000982 [Colletotrichum jinshuiense]